MTYAAFTKRQVHKKKIAFFVLLICESINSEVDEFIFVFKRIKYIDLKISFIKNPYLKFIEYDYIAMLFFGTMHSSTLEETP